MGAQGTCVAMNNVVSQSVPHLHTHVVPRTKGDGLKGFFWPRTRYDDDAHAAAVAARIADALPDDSSPLSRSACPPRCRSPLQQPPTRPGAWSPTTPTPGASALRPPMRVGHTGQR